jgi:hypothetical protein
MAWLKDMAAPFAPASESGKSFEELRCSLVHEPAGFVQASGMSRVFALNN